jgi:hypothetical protein
VPNVFQIKQWLVSKSCSCKGARVGVIFRGARALPKRPEENAAEKAVGNQQKRTGKKE